METQQTPVLLGVFFAFSKRRKNEMNTTFLWIPGWRKGDERMGFYFIRNE